MDFRKTANAANVFKLLRPVMVNSLRNGGWLALLVSVVLVGCENNRYEIELRPEANVLHRSLTSWRVEVQQGRAKITAFPDTELKQIAEAYSQPVPASKARKYTFHGEFVGRTPKDLGGSGKYTYWTTRMGTLSLYAERFRGDDDLAGALEDRQKAADTVTTLFLGWFRAEIGADPDFRKLEEFINVDLRRDLRNLAIYFWTWQAATALAPGEDLEQAASNDKEFFNEFLVRIAQYFMERDYFTPAELPKLIRSLHYEDWDQLLKFVRTLVASKLGIRGADQAARRLTFLNGPSHMTLSLNNYLATTDEYKTFIKFWQHEHHDDPDAKRPKPNEFLVRRVWQSAGYDLDRLFRDREDELQVKLSCSSKPFASNGTWQERTRQVVWSRSINARDESPTPVLPALLFAFWSTPNESFQRKHFGKVVLEGKRLAEYCVWRKALDDAEGREWDEFVSSLVPDNNLLKRLAGFHFSNEPRPPHPDEDKPKSLADSPRELIKTGLHPPSPKTDCTGESEAPATGAVKGKVTFDGRPIEKGLITFTPIGDTKGTRIGGEIIDGAYSVPSEKGPTVGKHKVSIRASRKTGKKVTEYIPAKYNVQTTLTVEIKAGDNEYDFLLTK